MCVPRTGDPACPAGLLYILNDRNLKFVYMQWMKGEDAVRPADAFYDVFYDEDTFEATYGGKAYHAAKDDYDPGHRLTGFYQKVVRHQ